MRSRLAAALAAALGAAAGCGTTTEAELHCAEATARLERCCPAFVSTPVSCEAGNGPVAVSLAEARCIEASPCDALQAAVCARAVQRFDGVDLGLTFTELCP